MFDIWPKRCCCLIKKELKYAGPFGLAAILCGSVFIDRLNTKKALDTMKAAMKEIKEKKVSFYLFSYLGKWLQSYFPCKWRPKSI